MTYRMEEMTWPEFAAKKDRVVILPVGLWNSMPCICLSARTQ